MKWQSWLYHGGYSAKIENDGGGILNDCCDELSLKSYVLEENKTNVRLA